MYIDAPRKSIFYQFCIILKASLNIAAFSCVVTSLIPDSPGARYSPSSKTQYFGQQQLWQLGMQANDNVTTISMTMII